MFRQLLTKFNLLKRWLAYFIRAQTIYDLHAPKVYQFAQEVLEDERTFYAFLKIEHLREVLLQDHRIIQIKDYGAGSKVNPSLERKISNIARYAAIPPEVGQFLFQLVHFYQIENILELGTSLGISTAYLAFGNPTKTKVFSIEGCIQTSKLAKQNLDQLGLSNVSLYQGAFKDRLPQVLKEINQIDLLFLDGDHRKGASLDYFHQCLEKKHDQSIFILADIHWSKEMESAWKEIKKHPEVRLSIDLFHLGILFFDPAIKTRQDVTLIQAAFKPWRMGFFA